jgi:hypothetical protein
MPRATTRHEFDVEARVRIDTTLEACRIQNLSMGGAFVIGRALPIGTTITLWLPVPDLETEIVASCVVRWSTADGVGVQFDGLCAQDTWTLGQILHHHKKISPAA